MQVLGGIINIHGEIEEVDLFLATMLSKQSAILPKLGVRNINSIIFYMHVRNVEVYTRLMQGIYF